MIKSDSLDWHCPYPSQRAPVIARNIVATSQPLAAAAGINALRSGGNAVDAALATAITLSVVEPNNNGIGSDAFAIIWDGQSLHGLNASGKSPAGMHPDQFDGAMPVLGWSSVTVPGAVSAWVEMSRRFGKLPFRDLFTEAIHYAQDGFNVGPITGIAWQSAALTYKDYQPFMDTFMVEGVPPDIGSLVKLPDHASSLQSIADSNGESFYTGDLARAMVDDAAKNGALLSYDDLANHRCEWVDTIATSFAHVHLHEIPPNGQGLMALTGLGILRHAGIETYPLDSPDSIHLQIEATRIAYAEVERHLADINHMKVSPDMLLEDNYLAQRAGEISLSNCNPSPTAMSAGADTVYLTTADASGCMVSMIQSNFMGFGSGVVVPGTGISLQNRGAGFVLEAGHPNRVGGAKRPFHTIIPGFVTANGQPRMSFGVMGGHMQAQGHIQMMVRMFIHKQNPQAASDAPRWRVQENGQLALEDGFDNAIAKELENRGHDVIRGGHASLFGGAQLIYRLENGYCAGSDHRKEGLATGF
ncbi:MAG: gamma-glutamyltransferase family protein [Gammaproteobacteria bacterium]|nr:gamma-glutamyltransferase family protein [Gammaproteobacteria bacterium]